MICISTILTTLILFLDNLIGMNIAYYIMYQVIAILLFLLSPNAKTNIILFSCVCIINLIIGSTIHNSWFAVWAIISIGLFNSIMFPNIFSLSIEGLGKYREQGSSFLVMMILGGAILPIVQVHVADISNIMLSYLVPITGYVYILCYGLFYSKKQYNFIK